MTFSDLFNLRDLLNLTSMAAEDSTGTEGEAEWVRSFTTNFEIAVPSWGTLYGSSGDAAKKPGNDPSVNQDGTPR